MREEAKMKKAQISAFILIGVVILFIFAASYLVLDNINLAKARQVTPEGFAQQCLKISSQSALHLLSRHSKVPDLNPLTPKLPAEQRCVSLTTKDGISLLDDVEATQEQLPEIINAFFLDCLQDFKEIKKQGYQITALQPPKTKVTFTPDKLIVETDYDVEFRKGGDVDQLNQLYLAMQSEYKEIQNSMRHTAEQFIDTKEIPIEQYNKNPQALLITPDQELLIIAVDDSSNLYAPTNYTYILK